MKTIFRGYKALVTKARELGGHSSNREAVRAALTEYVERRSQLRILALFGTIDYDESYDYKRERRLKRG
jgi:hypothetical protein